MPQGWQIIEQVFQSGMEGNVTTEGKMVFSQGCNGEMTTTAWSEENFKPDGME